MSLLVPLNVLAKASDPFLVERHETHSRWRSETVDIDTVDLTDERLADLLKAANTVANKSFARVTDSIIRSRSGDFSKSIPTLKAAPEIISSYLRHHLIDGWIYRKQGEHMVAYLVTGVKHHEPRSADGSPYVSIDLAATGALGESGRGRSGENSGSISDSVNLFADDVVRKKVDAIFLDRRLYVETADLKADYEQATEHHREVLLGGFTEQFRLTGTPLQIIDDRSYSAPAAVSGRKVVDDTHPSTVTVKDTALSTIFADAIDADDEQASVAETLERRRKVAPNSTQATMALPIMPLIRVFDLATHEFLIVNSRDLTAYEYDQSLREKLVLPESHRDLLDILTTDIATFTGDIIEGKSAGNVVLAKGVPGVGKTLTAEVYSELIERPLYSIHSGALGTDAKSIRENLEVVFKRAKRWNAVLLLDEADVFVLERGTDIQQNAIVAEFLRTLEYFDGLMFMTTNRASNIDEAILSRTAAIIAYDIPTFSDAEKIWHVLAKNFGVELDPTLVETLVEHFEDASPRDVKMLLRLALRVAAHEDAPLNVDIFRRCSLFRGLTFHEV